MSCTVSQVGKILVNGHNDVLHTYIRNIGLKSADKLSWQRNHQTPVITKSADNNLADIDHKEQQHPVWRYQLTAQLDGVVLKIMSTQNTLTMGTMACYMTLLSSVAW